MIFPSQGKRKWARIEGRALVVANLAESGFDENAIARMARCSKHEVATFLDLADLVRDGYTLDIIEVARYPRSPRAILRGRVERLAGHGAPLTATQLRVACELAAGLV